MATECMTIDHHNRAEWTACFTQIDASMMCIEKIQTGLYETAQVLVNSTGTGVVYFARDGFVVRDDDNGQANVARMPK